MLNSITMNTDAKHLAVTEAQVRVQLSQELTRELGVAVTIAISTIFDKSPIAALPVDF